MPGDVVLSQIRSLIDYERLFAEFVEMRGRGAWRDGFCVFHSNTDTPALRLNVEEGYYRCMNPDCGASGDFIDFYMRVRDLRFPEAVEELARRVGVTIERDASRGDSGVIDEAIVESAHERLLASPPLLAWLEERRGLSRETVVRWQLGHDGQRYFIPIRDEVGRVVNIRRYKPNASGTDKMISWRAGYGGARLWPMDSVLSTGEALIVEGEMDCLLALQHGFSAVTATGGAGTWRDTWSRLFRGRDVAIAYDNDSAGRAGSAQVAAKLHGIARSVRIITIPLTEPPGADVTDYLHGHGHTADDLRGMIEAAADYQPADAATAPPEEESHAEPEDVHLSRASLADYHNSPIRVSVMVSGKTTAPFIVPHQVRLSCSMPGLPMCERCPVAAAAGQVQRGLEFDSNEILQFINTTDRDVERQLKRKTGVPQKCGYVQIEQVSSKNVEEIQVIPDLDWSDDDGEYVTRLCYYIGHGLQANRSYVMTGHTVTEPKRQLATHLIHTAAPSQSNIDAFRLTEDVIDDLSRFRPEGERPEDLWRKVDDIYTDLEAYFRIYQRRDIILACDLVFHSILGFSFQGERVARGWGEALIIGDSRTGKTTIVNRMINLYRAGEMSSGENTSLAGLVGGLHQIGNSWALRWGRIPLNDRRLLAIDEAGSLPPEHIERMSSIRSSGIAEIVKVHTERTHARTRQIWTSNPRSPRPLSSYSQGVLAVKELIGKPEDIARFDLIVTAASGDVDIMTVNATRARTAIETYEPRLLHQRVMWAWSRSAEQVRFTPEAETHVLLRATQQGEEYRYATEIPLVEPNEQRIKLARMAVAAAAMFFSTEDGETVLVRPEHVEFAYQFLERLYAKPSLSFKEYARIQRREYEVQNEPEIRRIISRQPQAAVELMQEEMFSQAAIGQILDMEDRDEIQRTVKKLTRYGFLRRRSARGYYVKTPAAIDLLRRVLSNGNGAFGASLSAPPREEQAVPDADGEEEPPW